LGRAPIGPSDPASGLVRTFDLAPPSGRVALGGRFPGLKNPGLSAIAPAGHKTQATAPFGAKSYPGVNSPLSYSSVDTASRLFRTRGIENVAVADLMKESGFTHGGFYNHFKSKEELVTEVVACSFNNAAKYLADKIATASDPQKGLTSSLSEYLSPAHRDSRDGGCPASALPVDSARNGQDVQSAFAEGVEAYLGACRARVGLRVLFTGWG
jgi:Bacterial regulatory proteins, tetR family